MCVYVYVCVCSLKLYNTISIDYHLSIDAHKSENNCVAESTEISIASLEHLENAK